MTDDAPLAAFLDTPETVDAVAEVLHDMRSPSRTPRPFAAISKDAKATHRYWAKRVIDAIRIPHHGKING